MRISKEQLGRVIKQEIDKVIKENVARRGTLQNFMSMFDELQERVRTLEQRLDGEITELPDMGHIENEG